MKTSPLNLLLMATGLLLLGAGIYRAVPLKINRAFWLNNIPMLVAVAAVVIGCWWVAGEKFLLEGVDASAAAGNQFFLIIVLLVPLIGFSTPLAHHFQETIARMLSTKWGFPISFLTSAISPSGNAFAAVVNKLWEKRELRPMLLYFTSTIPLTSITIFFIRRLGLGVEIAGALYRTNMIIALGLMPFFWIWSRILIK